MPGLQPGMFAEVYAFRHRRASKINHKRKTCNPERTVIISGGGGESAKER